MSKNRFYIFKKIVSIGIKYPFQLLKQINRKNLNTLLLALKTESPHQIIKNFYLKLTATSLDKKHKVYETNTLPQSVFLWTDADIQDLKNGKIFSQCTKASLVNNEFYIEGWALSEDSIESIKISSGGLLIGQANYHINRWDVACGHSYLEHRQKCGYQLSKSMTWNKEDIQIQITTKQGQTKIDTVDLLESFQHLTRAEQYPIFLEKNKLNKTAIRQITTNIQAFSFCPLFSIVVNVEATTKDNFDSFLKSIHQQYYPYWELYLVLNENISLEIDAILASYTKKDSKIKIVNQAQGESRLAATNRAINQSEGLYIILMESIVELCLEALYEVAKAIQKNPTIDFIYGDEDVKQANNSYHQPHFKPTFNLDLLLSTNYIGAFSIIKKTLGDAVDWLKNKENIGTAAHYDLYIRLSERTKYIHHISKILYHNYPKNSSNKVLNTAIEQASIQVLEDYLMRNDEKGKVLSGKFPKTFRIQRTIIKKELVSIIIPFKDQVEVLQTCLNSILYKTNYSYYEIILISNNSQEKKTFDYIQKIVKEHRHIQFFEYNVPFNYSKINNWSVQKTKGKYILLLNNDTAVIRRGWLSAMIEHIQRPSIGAVGAKLLFEDNTIQHAGIVLNIQGSAGHMHKFFVAENGGYQNRIDLIQNFSACTGACLLVKKELYIKVGGLDDINLKVSFSDVDLCLKLSVEGFQTIYTPYAELYHYESKSRKLKRTSETTQQFWRDLHFFRKKWQIVLQNGDPFYHINLSLMNEQVKIDLLT